MEFDEYQRKALETDRVRSPVYRDPLIEIIVPLLGLAGETGELLSEYKKRLRDGIAHKRFKERIADELGDILWYVSNTASKFELNLTDIATTNLEKVSDRFNRKTNLGCYLFDKPYNLKESLPRRFEVEIRQTGDKVPREVQCFYEGKKMGNYLTDNSHMPDGYRFHDVFHLAYVAILGWSPVARRLFNCKRKSDSRVDEIEDGGRASVIDEAVAALAFSYAQTHSYFEGIKELDHQLLDTIKFITSGLEVKECRKGDWERAILEGFRVWRQVRDNEGGWVAGDLDKQEFTYLGKTKPSGTKKRASR
jgi:NTP pyrophosphatase (non-canonical NTP hydrolase)